jgi:hypothetical protein
MAASLPETALQCLQYLLKVSLLFEVRQMLGTKSLHPSQKTTIRPTTAACPQKMKTSVCENKAERRPELVPVLSLACHQRN